MMPPQRKGTTRPLSLVHTKCNTEQLTRKSCPISDLENKGTSFPPTWQTHHTPVQGQCTFHVRWASLQVPEDNPCCSAQTTEGTACKLSLPDGIYRGHGFQRTVSNTFWQYSIQRKNSIKQLTPEGQCQNYHTLINPSSLIWKPLQI